LFVVVVVVVVPVEVVVPPVVVVVVPVTVLLMAGVRVKLLVGTWIIMTPPARLKLAMR
jgi:hypothetical protein